MNTTKNLSKELPRNPRTHLGPYALMARMIGKDRASQIEDLPLAWYQDYF